MTPAQNSRIPIRPDADVRGLVPNFLANRRKDLDTIRGAMDTGDFESVRNLGHNLRGIAGLYGSYDYLSPQLFRIASTGLSLGSNVQWWLAEGLALQGHASAGVGYTSTGTIRPSSGGQYNYGFAPQSALGLRLILGDRLSLDLGARAFFDGKVASREMGSTDRVLRGDAAVTYRVHGPHALTLKYLTSRRRFSFPNILETQQRYDSVGLYYSYQPSNGMGAVKW